MIRADATPTTAPPLVVVADDDDEFRAMLAAEITGMGYEVVTARHAKDVISYLAATLVDPQRHRRPRALVTDLRMPGRNGLELLAALTLADLDVPVILMTAFGDGDVHRRARRLGAAAVLDKPFAVRELRTALARVAGRGARR